MRSKTRVWCLIAFVLLLPGLTSVMAQDAPSAPVGEMEQVLRHAIMGMIGGGTNEIQRNVIAQRGLELPR